MRTPHLCAFIHLAQHSGYYKIDEVNKTNEHYFYWMFESRSRPKTDPFVLWLTGGPGCSGEHLKYACCMCPPCTASYGFLGLLRTHLHGLWSSKYTWTYASSGGYCSIMLRSLT